MNVILAQVGTLLFCGALFSHQAYALHEIDHRFTISGYVRDDGGEAQSGKTVVVKDAEGGTLGTATSGPTGFYSIRLHLHNEDLGRNLRVSTGQRTQDVQVTFDPDNVRDERIVEVHFGAAAIERPLWESPTFLAVSAVIIVGGALYIAARRRKRSHRAQHASKKRKTKRGTKRRAE